MGNSNSGPKISAQDRAILDLKNQRDKLRQYQKRITLLTDREESLARDALRRKDRRGALLSLRRKKYQESLLSKTDLQLAQLEALTGDVEFALVQKDVYYGLQQGTSVLKAIQREMGGIEGVERLVGESEEARRYQEEVGEMLSGALSNAEEEEVEEELARLAEAARPAAERVQADLPAVPAATEELPAAPGGEVEGREKVGVGRRAAEEALPA